MASTMKRVPLASVENSLPKATNHLSKSQTKKSSAKEVNHITNHATILNELQQIVELNISNEMDKKRALTIINELRGGESSSSIQSTPVLPPQPPTTSGFAVFDESSSSSATAVVPMSVESSSSDALLLDEGADGDRPKVVRRSSRRASLAVGGQSSMNSLLTLPLPSSSSSCSKDIQSSSVVDGEKEIAVSTAGPEPVSVQGKRGRGGKKGGVANTTPTISFSSSSDQMTAGNAVADLMQPTVVVTTTTGISEAHLRSSSSSIPDRHGPAGDYHGHSNKAPRPTLEASSPALSRRVRSPSLVDNDNVFERHQYGNDGDERKEQHQLDVDGVYNDETAMAVMPAEGEDDALVCVRGLDVEEPAAAAASADDSDMPADVFLSSQMDMETHTHGQRDVQDNEEDKAAASAGKGKGKGRGRGRPKALSSDDVAAVDAADHSNTDSRSSSNGRRMSIRGSKKVRGSSEAVASIISCEEAGRSEEEQVSEQIQEQAFCMVSPTIVASSSSLAALSLECDQQQPMSLSPPSHVQATITEETEPLRLSITGVGQDHDVSLLSLDLGLPEATQGIATEPGQGLSNFSLSTGRGSSGSSSSEGMRRYQALLQWCSSDWRNDEDNDDRDIVIGDGRREESRSLEVDGHVVATTDEEVNASDIIVGGGRRALVCAAEAAAGLTLGDIRGRMTDTGYPEGADTSESSNSSPCLPRRSSNSPPKGREDQVLGCELMTVDNGGGDDVDDHHPSTLTHPQETDVELLVQDDSVTAVCSRHQLEVDLSSSGFFGLNDESCSSDATVPVPVPLQGLRPGQDQQPGQGLGSTVDDDDILIAEEVCDLLAPAVDEDNAVAVMMMEAEVFDFLNTSNGHDIPLSSSSSMGHDDDVCADPTHTDSIPDDHGLSVEGTDSSTCVDATAMAVAMTDNEEIGVHSSRLFEPYLSTALLATASATGAAVIITPTSTSEMSAEVLVPSAELLATACVPSCLMSGASLMVGASEKGNGGVEPPGLFASPGLDASAVGFAVALLSLLSVHHSISDNDNSDADGMDLVQKLAPWLWSLLPLLRSSPTDGEEDDLMDCNDPQTIHQATAAFSDVLVTTASSSSGSGAGKRKGKQKTATGKEKAGKKGPNNQEGQSLRPRGHRRVQFCFVDGSSVQPPGKDCFCGPALRTARRLMSLIDRVDALLHKLAPMPLAAALRACQMLAHCPSSSTFATALIATFALESGLCPRAGDMAAIARLLASELAAGLALVSSSDVVSSSLPKLSGTRTVLRHRAAWMATAVLRAQLRWLLDPPPQAISAAAATPTSPSSSSDYPITVSNSDSNGSRSRHWCDLHRFVLLKEAIPLPVYIPPPEMTDDGDVGVPGGNRRGRPRRKSDVVTLRQQAAPDHCLVAPAEMPLSSLLAVALRQIFDAHSCLLALMMAATPSSLHPEPSSSLSSPMLPTHGDEGIATVALLSAAVRHHATAPLPTSSVSSSAGASIGLLDGLLAHQPQLALAAEHARAFLCALLTFPAVLTHLEEEEEGDKEETSGAAPSSSLWNIVVEAAGMVARQGMPEDRHLCLFVGGWRGLLGWCLSHRMLSDHATMQARVHVETLKRDREAAAGSSSGRGGKSRLGETDEAVLLLDALIYDFPDIVSPPDHSNDDVNRYENDDSEAMSVLSNDDHGHGSSDDDPSANWLDNMCAE